MKLASLKDRTRDGKLVVVSRDVTRYITARPIASTLQDALDDWLHVAPRLADLAYSLEVGAVPSERFREHDAHSPLPRAYQWVGGAAFVNHVEVVRKAHKVPLPETLLTEPLLYQGCSGVFLDPRAPIVAASEDYGIDIEGEVAVVVGDVPMGASREEAAAAICLVMLANTLAFRALISGDLDKGFRFFQSRPPSAYSPVAVTPDELGAAWQGGKLHLPLNVALNGKLIGKANAGTGMTFDFPALIVHAAKTRPLAAGTIIGSGPVSNRDADGEPGKAIADGGLGYSSLGELRAAEILQQGGPKTPLLKFGDTVRIEMNDADGHSLFGAIEQTIEPKRTAGA